MRRLLAATGLTAACLMIASSPVWAAGNVLLPTDNDSGVSSLPSLGLTPTPAAPAKAAPSETAPASPPKTGTTATPAPQTTAAPFPSAGATAPSSGGVTPQVPPLFTFINPPANAPRGTQPGRIVNVPDASQAMVATAMAKIMPYSLTISVDGKSLFGANDVQKIRDKLGIQRSQIPNSCILTLRGLIQTTKGTYMIDGSSSSPQATVYYDGMINSFMMTSAAFCTTDALPADTTFLIQYGGRYKVDLGAVNCPPPTRQTTQLSITYDGTENSTCTYQ
jgi:hypothetical protein